MLLVDVGNTQILVGLRDDSGLVQAWRMATDVRRTADEYRAFLRSSFELASIDSSRFEAAVVASVVPEVQPSLLAALSTFVGDKLLLVGPGVRTGVAIRVDSPKEVGADRIVNAAAAFDLYAKPLIVVDFGTATTFDVVAADGAYLGGAIAPGLQASHDALVRRTSRLRRVDLVEPARAIGRSTEEAMQSGMFYGYAGLITGLVSRLREEAPEVELVVATGGLARPMAALCTVIDAVEMDLTLHGLWVIWARHERMK
jgi:type III pantothenate kinase